MKYLKKTGAIEATSIYVDTQLCANDCTVTLPEITFATADIQAMGTISLPLLAVLEDMETSITKMGIDRDMSRLCTPGVHALEYRWVQDAIDTDGSVKPVGCKAFMNVLPVTIQPGGSIEVGSASENDLTYKVTRYKLVVDGEEIVLVDRLAHKLTILGTEYTSEFDNYL